MTEYNKDVGRVSPMFGTIFDKFGSFINAQVKSCLGFYVKLYSDWCGMFEDLCNTLRKAPSKNTKFRDFKHWQWSFYAASATRYEEL